MANISLPKRLATINLSTPKSHINNGTLNHRLMAENAINYDIIIDFPNLFIKIIIKEIWNE